MVLKREMILTDLLLIYGFKSRAEYDKKSARLYDDERRRMESLYFRFMHFSSTFKIKILRTLAVKVYFAHTTSHSWWFSSYKKAAAAIAAGCFPPIQRSISAFCRSDQKQRCRFPSHASPAANFDDARIPSEDIRSDR